MFLFYDMSGRRRILLTFIGLMAAGIAWFLWSPWPDPAAVPLPWKPDAILILGGGREERVRQGKLLADIYTYVPVIVTGDGGAIVKGLVDSGLSRDRIIHEEKAGSTIENAVFTAPVLELLQAKRVVLVTSWFHMPRSLAVFRSKQPSREFATSFEIKPTSPSFWDRKAQRYERIASLVYLLRYGVWSW